jgi:iron complex outermembrane receptor protein
VTEGNDAFVDVRYIAGKKGIGDIIEAIRPGGAIYYPVERRAVSAGLRARF